MLRRRRLGGPTGRTSILGACALSGSRCFGTAFGRGGTAPFTPASATLAGARRALSSESPQGWTFRSERPPPERSAALGLRRRLLHVRDAPTKDRPCWYQAASARRKTASVAEAGVKGAVPPRPKAVPKQLKSES